MKNVHAPTPPAELERALERLAAKSDEFVRLTVRHRIRLLEGLLRRSVETGEGAVRAACRAKGIDWDSPLSAEEWFSGPVIQNRHIRLLIESLTQVERFGVPRVDWKGARLRQDGRLRVPVFPVNPFEHLIFPGFRGDVWLERGIDLKTARHRQASFYRQPRPKGGVSLVLGAGNVASIGPLDVLHRMFTEGRVVILKMNPVNDYLGAYIETQFAELIARGYLAVVYGGADVGAHLTAHPLVDDIHITGSDRTYDAIVWGPPGPERDARKSRGEPVNDKPVTAELGNVTPVLITPGPYTERELRAMASNVAAMVTNNASFNCNAAKLLVTARGWRQRTRFFGLLGERFAATPPRRAYYPGAFERYASLVDGRDGVTTWGTPTEGALPWTLLRLDADDRDEPAFRTEPFCPVVSEVQLPTGAPGGTADIDGAAAFLEAAVPFVNERVWGTLCATVFVNPRVEKSPQGAAVLDQALAGLRYGCVGVNHWAALAYAFCTTPWGAAPGSTPDDIQSGTGWVHNTLMLENIDKAIIRGPLVQYPKPPWFGSHRTAHKLARRLATFEGSPRLGKTPGLMWDAIRG